MGQSESSMEDSDWFIQIRTAAHVRLCDSAAVRNDGAAVRNGKRVPRVVTTSKKHSTMDITAYFLHNCTSI